MDRNRYRLHDLEDDPGEHYNIALDYPEIEQYLEERLRQRIVDSLKLRARLTGAKGIVKDTDTMFKLQLDDAQKEHLRSLGYVL